MAVSELGCIETLGLGWHWVGGSFAQMSLEKHLVERPFLAMKPFLRTFSPEVTLSIYIP